MADSTLIYAVLCLAIHSIYCNELELSGIPTVNYGSRQRLKCKKGGWRGISDVTFSRDGQDFTEVGRFWGCYVKLLDDTVDEKDFGYSCSWTTRTLIINNVNDYNNTVWKCRDKREISNEYKLTVQDLTPCSFNVTISGNVSDVVEGDNVTLACSSNTTDGEDSWTIYYNNGSTDTRKTNRIYFNPISRADTGMYSCQIEKEDCLSEAQIYIKVQYHPNASIHSEPSNSTINMTCIGDGYPDNFTFYDWHHYINGQLVRVLEGNDTRGSSILILTGATALDNGEYVCLLSNGLPDEKGNLNSSAEYEVVLPASPMALENSTQQININKEAAVNMTSVFLTDDVTSVTLITPNDSIQELNVPDVIKEENRDIQVYGTKINMPVIVVEFSLHNVTTEGRYHFKLCNKRNRCNVSYDYYITFNSKVSPRPNNKEEQKQTLPIILGTVVAVVVIMVIVIIAICVIVSRRKSITSKEISPNSKLDSRCSNPAYEARNVEIIPNELYDSSEPKDNNTQMEIIPNELYHSSEPKDSNTQMEIIPNELYHSSDRNDNNIQMEIIPNELYVPSDPKQYPGHTDMEIIPNELYVSADAEDQSVNRQRNAIDESYVSVEALARNKEIQKQAESSYSDNDHVYMNDPTIVSNSEI